MTLIQAPTDRVEAILDRQKTLAQLLDNEWMALAVMDPERDNTILRYQPGGEWVPHDASASVPAEPAWA
jgi:uncharacterized protein YbcC (UPF0753/DUF2309 family)